MTVPALVLVTLLLGGAVRAARSAGLGRPVGVGVGRAFELGGAPRRWLPVALRGQRITDPAPLLRFRSAIERGASTLQAFESVGAGGGAWAPGARRLVRRVASGAGVQPAMDAWVAEDSDPALRLLADALAISSATGGSHLRAVDAVIEAVRERAAVQREARALASQAQSSAAVLVGLPVVFAVAVAVLDPRVRAFYLTVPVGPLCVAIGLALDGVGAVAMARLVRAVT